MKRSRLNQKSPSANAVLERRLDALWSKTVKERDGYRCVRCSCSNNYCRSHNLQLQSAHIIPKGRAKSIRWDKENGLTMCEDITGGRTGCHDWAHDNPTAFKLWVEQHWPSRWMNLVIKSRAVFSCGGWEYDLIERELRS